MVYSAELGGTKDSVQCMPGSDLDSIENGMKCLEY